MAMARFPVRTQSVTITIVATPSVAIHPMFAAAAPATVIRTRVGNGKSMPRPSKKFSKLGTTNSISSATRPNMTESRRTG